MVSAGLPLLLLISSTLLISIMSKPTSTDQNQLQEYSTEKLKKAKESIKANAKKVLDNIEKISSVVVPFLEILSVSGLGLNIPKLIFSVVGLGSSFIKKNKDLETFMNEFENLNYKLDQNHVEQKWDSWESATYHKPEKNIEVAWTKFKTLSQSLTQATNGNDDTKLDSHKELFKKEYAKYEPATKTLHTLLTAKGVSFIKPLGDLLAEHVNCHEKNLREYTVLILKLFYKANIMNQFYYALTNTQSEARIDEESKITYEASLSMFKMHMQCINNSLDYIKKDVTALIDKTKKHSELAKEIWLFLVEVYDRYDWMVVAFVNKKSSHETLKSLNRHVMSGFTVVTKNTISVAVARQVKGKHTKAALVNQAIGRCIDESVLCYNVAEKLQECTETMEGIPVSRTYTAVHAYRKHADDSQNLPDEVYAAPEEREDKYIYKGKCKKSPGVKGGKFVVLIKSDEEIMTKDPCSKVDCGGNNKGTCVRFNGNFLAGCECKLPYYGQNCEESLDDYKKALMKDNNSENQQ